LTSFTINWEAVTAVSTAFTGLVIFFTVIFARHQLHLTRQQLEQLRKSSQLEGAVAIFADIDGPKVENARQFVLHELGKRMQDPQFRLELQLIALVDETVHKELIVLRAYERVGAYVDEGLIDAEVVYLGAIGRIISTWMALKDVVAVHRQLAPWAWMSYEHLADGARKWATAHGGDAQTIDQLLGQVLTPKETL
jgi:hypothetical protein